MNQHESDKAAEAAAIAGDEETLDEINEVAARAAGFHQSRQVMSAEEAEAADPLRFPPSAGLRDEQDRVRHHRSLWYHAPSPAQFDAMNKVRGAAAEFLDVIFREVPPCADRSAALRKVREALHAATGAIVLDGLI